MIIKSIDLQLSNLNIKDIEDSSQLLISSNFLSLEEITFFYLKILPSLLIKKKFFGKVFPYFSKLNNFSKEAQGVLILLNEDKFRDILKKMYNEGYFKKNK